MIQDISRSIEACAAFYGDEADAVRQYLIEGQRRALHCLIAVRYVLMMREKFIRIFSMPTQPTAFIFLKMH